MRLSASVRTRNSTRREAVRVFRALFVTHEPWRMTNRWRSGGFSASFYPACTGGKAQHIGRGLSGCAAATDSCCGCRHHHRWPPPTRRWRCGPSMRTSRNVVAVLFLGDDADITREKSQARMASNSPLIPASPWSNKHFAVVKAERPDLYPVPPPAFHIGRKFTLQVFIQLGYAGCRTEWPRRGFYCVRFRR